MSPRKLSRRPSRTVAPRVHMFLARARLLERPEFVGLTKRGQERRWKLLEAAYNDNLKKGEQGYKTASQLKNIVMDTVCA